MLHLKKNNSKIKPLMIIHLSTEMPMGGGECQLLYLYRGLRERNILQTIICSQGSKLEQHCKNHQYNYISLKRRGGFSFKYAWNLKKILQKIKKISRPLIHCHDSHAHTHAILADILNLHYDSLPFIVSRKVISLQRKKNLNWITCIKYNYPNVKKIHCVSEAVADICKNWIKLKHHNQKIVILHDTLILSDYLPSKPHNCFSVGIIASLIPVKDHLLFLKSAQKILVTHSSLYFLIIGEGPLRKSLETQAKMLNISSHLKFLGFRKDIPELLSQLDLLLVTSKNEGLCGTILQAMAAEVPVIAKNVGGIPEIIEHNKTGLLAENLDDFVKYTLMIHDNPILGKNLTKAALTFVQEYDLSIYTEKMIAIYTSI